MKIKREYITFGTFLLVLIVGGTIVLLSAIPITYKIDETIPGIIWESENPAYIEETEVRISGKYKKYILSFFRDYDTFTGTFQISGNEYTSEYLMYPLNLHHERIIPDSIWYFKGSTSYTLGSLHHEDLLSTGVIMLSNTIDETDRYLISYPATNREEALQLGQYFFPEFELE